MIIRHYLGVKLFINMYFFKDKRTAFFIMVKQLAANVINTIKMHIDKTMKLLVQTRKASKQNITTNAKMRTCFS